MQTSHRRSQGPGGLICAKMSQLHVETKYESTTEIEPSVPTAAEIREISLPEDVEEIDLGAILGIATARMADLRKCDQENDPNAWNTRS